MHAHLLLMNKIFVTIYFIYNYIKTYVRCVQVNDIRFIKVMERINYQDYITIE